MSTVKELRAQAKDLGISPLPTRKADLVAAIRAKGGIVEEDVSSSTPQPSELATYTMKELRRLCKKHTHEINVPCGGKGATKRAIFDELARIGVLEGVAKRKPGAGDYARLLREADPELYAVAKETVPLLPNPRHVFALRGEVEDSNAPRNPWLDFYREQTALMAGIESGADPQWGRVLDFVQTGAVASPETLNEDTRSFVDAFPLISFVYARENADFLSLLTQVGATKPFEISRQISDPGLRIKALTPTKRGGPVLESNYGEINADALLHQLPPEMGNHIMQFVPVESYTSAILASRFFHESEKAYRELQMSYGSYTLSGAQTTAMKWSRERRAEQNVLIVQAPPSWGKTVFAIASAIDAVRRGERVHIYTTKAMLRTFLNDMQAMMGRAFPDLSLGERQRGRYDILVPSLNKEHAARFTRGEQCDIILSSQHYMASRAERVYFDTIPPAVFSRGSPVEHYPVDLVILDEAHKKSTINVIWDNLFRNPQCRFLLLSASEVRLLSTKKLEASEPLYLVISWDISVSLSLGVIRFERKTIEGETPGYRYTVRVYKEPSVSFAEPRYTAPGDRRQFIDSFPDPKLARLIELPDLLADTTGNVVVFMKVYPRLPTSQRDIRLSALRDPIVNSTIVPSALKTPERAEDDIDTESVRIPVEKLKDAAKQGDPYYWHRKPHDVSKFVAASTQRPSTFITTYRKSAEGINFNTIDTIVLMDAEEVGHDKIYQAISRALRVKNSAKTVRIIAIAGDSEPEALLKVHMRFADEDFRKRYHKYLSTRYGGNSPNMARSRQNIFFDLVSKGRKLHPREIYVIFGPQLPAGVQEFWREEGLFEGEDLDRIAGAINGTRRGRDTNEPLSKEELSDAILSMGTITVR